MLTQKRIGDFFLGIPALVILSPVLLAAALMVRLSLGKPVLFRQERPGLRGKPFTLYKFRTMTDDKNSQGQLLPDGRRLTPIGGLLRNTSLDELPELINVLRGDMSLIGPRPLLMRYLPWFTAEEQQRFRVRPGITGWAQVNGRNFLSWDERLAMDVWYVENWSPCLDLKILLMTVAKVFTREGLAADPDTAETDLDREREEKAQRKRQGESAQFIDLLTES
ncbi:MAG: sugar transferase [Deltaproteobacteria bacterium]|nr:sugar transferase [Deltaproteobacteria bacterium]